MLRVWTVRPPSVIMPTSDVVPAQVQRRTPIRHRLFRMPCGGGTWEHNLAGLQFILPELGIPVCHGLALGDIFICNLSRPAWLFLRGWRQYLPEGGSIGWRRPRPTDGVVSSPFESPVYNFGESLSASDHVGYLMPYSDQSVCSDG